MAPPTKKKKTEEDTTSTKATSALPYTPEALLALMGKQQIQKDTWNPSVVNLGTSGVPAVQTQLAGTQYYDTSPNQFIAPGYEHLRELANKKDLEGKQNKSVWDNFISNIDQMNVDNNASHMQLMQNVKGSLAEHSDKLRKGLWSENNGMISEFVNDISTKKGLSSLMSAYKEREAAKEANKALSADYDPATATGGSAPHHRRYIDANPGYVTDVEFNEKGEAVSVPKFVPNTIFEARNLFDESSKAMKDFMASSAVSRNKDGSISFDNLPPEMLKFGLMKREYASEEELRQSIADRLLVTGGYEYLAFDSKAAAFERASSATVEDLRESATTLAKNFKGEDPFLNKMVEADDETLLKNAQSILTKEEFLKRKNAVINGVAEVHSFTKEDYSYVDDKMSEKLIDHEYALKLKAAKGGGEGEDGLNGLGVTKYVLTSDVNQLVETINPAGAYSINKRITDIRRNIPALEKQLKELESSAGYNNLPQHSVIKGQIESMQNELKTIEATSNGVIKGYGDYIKKEHNVSFNDIYQQDYLKSVPQGTTPIERKYFFQAITAAIAAESDGNSKTTAAEELRKAGIPLGVNSFRKGGLGDYNNVQRSVGSSFSMGTAGGSSSISTNSNILNFTQSMGKSIQKNYEQNKDFYKKYNIAPSLQTDITYINPPIGASATDVEATNMVNTWKALSKQAVENIEGVVLFDPSGKTKISPSAGLMEEFGFSKGDMAKVFDMDAEASTVVPTTTQTYGEGSGLVYALKLKVRTPTDSTDSHTKKLIERVKEQIGDDQFYERRITLGSNQASYDRLVANSLRALYLKGQIDKDQIPDVIQQQMAITYGSAVGINKAIDAAHIDNLDGNPVRPASVKIKFNDQDFHITALDIDGGKDKIFTLQGVENGVKKWLAFDKQGNSGYYTTAELEANKDLEKKTFDTDLDVKAFFSQGYLDAERATASANFNKGTVTGNTVPNKNIPAYKPTTLINNPTKITNIINKYSNNKSSLTATDYIEVSRKTGVPIDLLLAQGIAESNFGTAGRAVRTRNVGNVGNTDSGAAEYRSSWRDGLFRQAKLLKEEYNVQSPDDVQRMLNTRFARPRGGNYATDSQYHVKIGQILQELHKISLS